MLRRNIILAGDFERKLRKLNPELHIFCGDWDTRPAGIFHILRGEYTEICGIDKHYIPERSIMAPHGAHIKGGWRRALRILIGKGLIYRPKAERLFKTKLPYRVPKRTKRPTINTAPENFYSSRS